MVPLFHRRSVLKIVIHEICFNLRFSFNCPGTFEGFLEVILSLCLESYLEN